MNSKKLFATIALSAVLLTGCAVNNKDVIITVNDKKITQQDFDNAFETFSQQAKGVDLQKDKKDPLYLLVKDRVVNELVVRELVNQEIEKRGIKVTSQEEEQELKNIIDKFGSKERLQEILRQNGISNDKFKKDMIAELKMKKLLSMLGDVKVSDNDAKNFYKSNPEKFKYPERVRASHILISANPKEIRDAITAKPENKSLTDAQITEQVNKQLQLRKDKAQKVLAEAQKSPNNFAKLAREYSEDIASGEKGGDLGFFASTDMVEPFSKAAFSLKPNKVSNLVQSDYGYHIILVTDRMKAGTEPYEKVKEDIKKYLVVEKQVKLLENLITSLKSSANIKFINEDYKPEKIEQKLQQTK